MEELNYFQLQAINGGGRIAKKVGSIIHYLVDTFYKASEVDNLHHRGHP
jgi:bacteriocin-like protein